MSLSKEILKVATEIEAAIIESRRKYRRHKRHNKNYRPWLHTLYRQQQQAPAVAVAPKASSKISK